MRRQLLPIFTAAHMIVAAASAADSPVPPPAAAPRVSVLTPPEVVQILDQTSDWYRSIATQQQIATQPSDLLIVYANRQIADKVVALAFDMARANAELLSSEAETAQKGAENAALASVDQRRAQLDAQRRAIQQEMAGERQKLEAGKAGKGKAKLQELEGELAMNAARANLIDTMGDFVDHSNPKRADAQALKSHIDAIEASIPTANNAVLSSQPGAASPPPANSAAAAPPGQAEKPEVRKGIWDLAGNAVRLRSKIKAIEVIDEQTKELAGAFHTISEAPLAQLQAYTAQSDALASQADTAGTAALQGLRAQFDTLAWRFKETSEILLPLSKQAILLQQYRHNLGNWRDATRRQYREAMRVLAIRLSILLGLLAAVVIVAEIWRRAVRRYVRDAGRLLDRLNELTRCDCTTRNPSKARALARRMDELEARIAQLREQEELDAIRPDLDGTQVMEQLGLPPGRDVGRALAHLLELRMDEGPLGEQEARRRLSLWWAEQGA